MAPSFQLQFYKGDTPVFVVDLTVISGPVDIHGMSVKLFVQDFQVDAVINQKNQAAFFIRKEISQQLRTGTHKVWIQFITENTKYSFYGYFKVIRARQ